jgi:uracil-DNA glycosylase family 4
VNPEINHPEKGGVLLVGRDPGQREQEEGQPFVGTAGKILDEALSQGGLRREDVNITNVVPWKPYGNKFENHRAEDIEVGLAELYELCEQLEPKLIIAMGNEANWALIDGWPGDTIHGAKGITDRRGFFWTTTRGTLLSTIHPANVAYKAMPNAMLLDLDFRRAHDWLIGKMPLEPFPKYLIVRSYKDLEPLYDSTCVAVDIENYRDRTDLLCVGFCGDDLLPRVVPLELLVMAQEFLASDVPKVLHNGMHDIYILRDVHGWEFGGEVHDTMYQHWALFPELAAKEETGGEDSKGKLTRKGLAFLASMRHNVEWWKDYPEKFDDDRPQMYRLNAMDCYETRRLHSEQMAEIEKQGVQYQYQQRLDLLPISLKLQKRGLPVNEKLLDDRVLTLTTRQEALEASIYDVGMQFFERYKPERFRVRSQCECCHGTVDPEKPVKKKTLACWSCLGFEKPPKRSDLIELCDNKACKWKKAELEEHFLKPCAVCDGKGYHESYDWNPMSAQQMVELLMNHIGVPKSLFGRKPSGDEATLAKVLRWAKDLGDDPLASARKSIEDATTSLTGLTHGAVKARKSWTYLLLSPYARAKRDRTIITAYERIRPGADGRIHTRLDPIGTSTGRYASREYDVGDDDESTNMQNLTKKVAKYDPLYNARECIVAPPGWLLWAIDYSGAEALLAAAYQGDWWMYEKLLAGYDVHRWTMGLFFGLIPDGLTPDEQVEWCAANLEKGDVRRNIAKNVRYAYQYKAGVWKLTETVNREVESLGIKPLTQREIEKYRNILLQVHPTAAWWAAEETNLLQEGYTRNCLGFKRTFYYPDFEKRLKEALANYPQSTVASLITDAMIEVDRTLDELNRFEMRLQVHDEIMGLVREDLAHKYLPQVKAIMERPFRCNGRDIHIPADVSVGKNWGKMEEWK